MHDEDDFLLFYFNEARERRADGGDIVGEGASWSIGDAGKCNGFCWNGERVKMLDERAKVSGTVKEAVDQESCRGRIGTRHGSLRNGQFGFEDMQHEKMEDREFWTKYKKSKYRKLKI